MFISAILFGESADEDNRYAYLSLDSAIDTTWIIALNGTDNNGDRVTPSFITIDNYNNAGALSYSVDNLNSSVAPYTTIVLAINPATSRLVIQMTTGQTNIYISEKKLPVTEGLKYNVTAGGNTPIVTKYLFVTGGATFVVPSDWNSANNKVHCIGPGSNGIVGGASIAGNGGGGGGYGRKNNVVLSPGANVACQIGANNSGNDTWIISNKTVLGAAATANSTQGGNGSVGTVTNNGGNGAGGTVGNGGGGGGAGSSAGPGIGPSLGGAGGASGDGLAGGAAGSNPGAAGVFWTQTNPVVTAGAGSGAGGSNAAGVAGGIGGNYGGGGGGGKGTTGAGGAGGAGLIVLEWTP